GSTVHQRHANGYAAMKRDVGTVRPQQTRILDILIMVDYSAAFQDGGLIGQEDGWARGLRRSAGSAVAMAAGRQLQSSSWSIDVAIYGWPVPPVCPARPRHPRLSKRSRGRC